MIQKLSKYIGKLKTGWSWKLWSALFDPIVFSSLSMIIWDRRSQLDNRPQKQGKLTCVWWHWFEGASKIYNQAHKAITVAQMEKQRNTLCKAEISFIAVYSHEEMAEVQRQRKGDRWLQSGQLLERSYNCLVKQSVVIQLILAFQKYA